LNIVWGDMSKNEWCRPLSIGLFVLAVATVIAGFILGHQLGEEFGNAEYSAAYHEQYATDKIKNECLTGELVGRELHDCIEKSVVTSYEHHTAYANLQAQERIANWAAIVGVITGIGVLATFIGIIFIKLTLDETRAAVRAANNATKTTRKLGEAQARLGRAQVRAYLSLADVQVTLDPGDPGGTMTVIPEKHLTDGLGSGVCPSFIFIVKNSGGSPAKGVSSTVTAEFTGIFNDGAHWIIRDRKSADRFPLLAENKSSYKQIAAGGEISQIVSLGLELSKEEISRLEAGEGNGDIKCSFVISVGFRDVFDEWISEDFQFHCSLRRHGKFVASPFPVAFFEAASKGQGD